MDRLHQLRRLARPGGGRVLLWVFDGVGGLPHPQTGRTELEVASLPHLDAFAARAACGGLEPAGPGIAAGSGRGHLGLFGYPSDERDAGRGVFEVLGAEGGFVGGKAFPMDGPRGFSLLPGDLTMRGNFARLLVRNGQSVVADRRANKVTDRENARLCRLLSERVSLGSSAHQLFVFPGREHRFGAVVRGPGLAGNVSDGDPGRSNLPLRPIEALSPDAELAAGLAQALAEAALEALADEPTADAVLLRGFGLRPDLPTLQELYSLRVAAVAAYPMYRGLARLLGMAVASPAEATEPEALLIALDDAWRQGHDLIYFHVKETDNLGHRGDFDGKVAALEAWDARFARALEICQGADVVVVTGDHNTPAVTGQHSWHPVPTALWWRHCLSGPTTRYTERDCLRGTLGIRPSRDLMALILASAGRLDKLGP